MFPSSTPPSFLLSLSPPTTLRLSAQEALPPSSRLRLCPCFHFAAPHRFLSAKCVRTGQTIDLAAGEKISAQEAKDTFVSEEAEMTVRLELSVPWLLRYVMGIDKEMHLLMRQRLDFPQKHHSTRVAAPYDIKNRVPLVGRGAFRVRTESYSPHPDMPATHTVHQVMQLADLTSGLPYWNRSVFLMSQVRIPSPSLSVRCHLLVPSSIALPPPPDLGRIHNRRTASTYCTDTSRASSAANTALTSLSSQCNVPVAVTTVTTLRPTICRQASRPITLSESGRSAAGSGREGEASEGGERGRR